MALVRTDGEDGNVVPISKAAGTPKAPTREIGDSGLSQTRGVVTEEFADQLKGRHGVRVYIEMRDNEPVIGATIYGFTEQIRSVEWTVEAAGDSPEDEERAELLS